MAGLPKKFAKMGFKKGWAAFRAIGGKRKKRAKAKKHTRHARPKRARRKKTRVPTGETQQKGVAKMAKRRKRGFRGRARRVGRRVGRRMGVAMETRPGKVVTMAVEAAAGGVVSSLIVNKAPMIRDQGRGVKAMVQGGLGLAAIMFVRNKHAKSLGAGAVIAAAMGVAKEFLKLEPLAGPSAGSRTLSPSEMARITRGQMNMPMPGIMNAPLTSAPANAGFNRSGFGS